MAKFDVYRRRSGEHYLVDCQSDLLDFLNTRLVVPLIPAAQAPHPAARLNPSFEIEGAMCVMATQFAFAIPVRELRSAIASLGEHDVTIGNALDMLISGF